MSSDEDDYMSDKFVQNAGEDFAILPLLSRNSDKRALDILKRKKEAIEKIKQKKKSMKILEQEKREEGLGSAISSDNKGFAMLAKMGYKPGQGIGKSQTGIAEPISINIKDGKSGLGKDTQIKEFREKMKKREKEFNADEFRNRLATKKAEQLSKCDLSKSQRICEQMDKENDVKSPKETWFWPPVEKESSDSESEDESDEDDNEPEEDSALATSERLEIITKYLRSKYYYCIWCAVKYENEDDLKDNCPGNNRNEH